MAQQVVTELVIDSDTSGADRFTQAMGQASDAAQKGTSSASDASLAIAGVGVSMIAAFAGIQQGINYVVGLNKGLADLATMAKQVGLSLADIQGVQFGGQIAGLSTDQINSGLQKSASLLNDASRNANSLSKELEANGLSVKNANGQLISQNQLLGIAADLIKKAANPGDQLAIAQMLGFTKEWIPLLEQGSGAMSGLTSEAQKAGVVIDDEIIQRATEFDTQWRKSSLELSMYMKAALVGLLPYIDDLIAGAQKFIKGINAADIEKAANDQLKALADPIGLPENVGIKITIPQSAIDSWDKFKDKTSQAYDELSKMASDQNISRLLGALENWAPVAISSKVLGSIKDATSNNIIQSVDPKWSSDITPGIDDTSTANLRTSVQAKLATDAWLAEADAAKKLSGEINGLTNSFGAHSVVAAKDVTETRNAYESAINTSKRHTDQLYADADAVGLGAGALAAFRTEAQLTSAAEAAGIPITQAMKDKIADLADNARDAATDLEKLKIAAQIKFQRDTAFLSPEDVQIAQQLKGLYPDVATALGSVEAQGLRTNNQLKQLKDAAETFAAGFVKDLANGVPAVQALENALKTLASSLIDNAVKKLVDQALNSITSSITGAATGALSGAASATASATILATAGDAVGAAMISGATAAASILAGGGVEAGVGVDVGTSLGGAELVTSGVGAGTAIEAGGIAAGTAINGPIVLLIAAIAAIAGISFLGGGNDELQKNKDAWKGMTQQVTDFNNAAKGFNLGPITQSLNSLFTSMMTLTQAAVKAEDYAGAIAIQQTFNEGVARLYTEFEKGAETLTPLQTSLKGVWDEFNGLIQSLGSMGLLTTDLATTLENSLNVQLVQLTEAFKNNTIADLNNRLNAANGKDYINEASALIGQRQTDIQNLLSVGMDTSLADQVFAAGAQKMVDSSQLAGTAFDALIQQFPQLAGVVHAFVDQAAIDAKALADSQQTLGLQMRLLTANTDTSTIAGQLVLFDAKAKQEMDAAVAAGSTAQNIALLTQALDAERAGLISTADAAKAASAATEQLNLQMRLLTATTDSSTLTGALALFDAKAQQERDAAVAAGSANLVLLDQVQAAERLNIVNDFAQKAIDAEKQLADARLAQMQRIQQYLDGLTAGSSSTLAPGDRLAAASSQYSTQLNLAKSGDASALSNITTYSQNVLDAARSYYGSASGYQSIFSQVQQDLSALIGLTGAGVGASATSSAVSGIGVSSITSSPVAVNQNNDMATLIAAVNAANARIDAQTAEIVNLKNLVDTGNKVVAAASVDENKKLDTIATNTGRIGTVTSAQIAAPR